MKNANEKQKESSDARLLRGDDARTGWLRACGVVLCAVVLAGIFVYGAHADEQASEQTGETHARTQAAVAADSAQAEDAGATSLGAAPRAIGNVAELYQEVAYGGSAYLTADLELPASVLQNVDSALHVNRDFDLNLNGHIIKFSGKNCGALFVVAQDVSLGIYGTGEIDDRSAIDGSIDAPDNVFVASGSFAGAVHLGAGAALTLDATICNCYDVNDKTVTTASAVSGETSSRLVMKEHAAIRGCKGQKNVVCVSSFTMEGLAAIADCYGCDSVVSVSNGNAVLKSGSSIRNYNVGGAPNPYVVPKEGGALRVYGVTSTATIEKGACIEGCKAQFGGALYVQGDSIICNGTIRDCSAEMGGGIYANVRTLQLGSDCLIENCSVSVEYDDLRCYGGGVYVNRGDLVAQGFTITGCSSQHEGGGMYLDRSTVKQDSGMASVQNHILECSARSGGGLYGVSLQGALPLSMESCTAQQQGGGFYLSGGTLSSMANSRIARCTAGADGGGACVNDGATFELGSETSLEYCTAGRNGGGIYVADGTARGTADIYDCEATNTGGAIYVAKGSANFDEASTISWCSAATDPSVHADVPQGSVSFRGKTTHCSTQMREDIFSIDQLRDFAQTGGKAKLVNLGEDYWGMQLPKEYLGSPEDAVHITKDCLLDLNGVSITFDGSLCGALFVVERDVHLSIINSDSAHDYRSYIAGDLRITPGDQPKPTDAYAGAVLVKSGGSFELDTTIKNCFGCAAGNQAHASAVTVEQNASCTLGHHALISGCSGSRGAVWAHGGSVLMKSGSRIEDCTARYMGVEITGETNGGGVCADLDYFQQSSTPSVVIEEDAIIVRCSAEHGGGVSAVKGSVDCSGTIKDCSAILGGGMYLSNADATLGEHCIISGCTAQHQRNTDVSGGGGVFITYGTLTGNGFTCMDCVSEDDGGGVCLQIASLAGPEKAQNKLVRCTAKHDGGGVYAMNGKVDASLNLAWCESGHDGAGDGAGLFATASGVTLKEGSEFDTCDARGNGGGAALVKGSSLKAPKGYIAHDCFADANGGALYVKETSLETMPFVASNCRANSGGAAYLDGCSLTALGGDTAVTTCAAQKGSAFSVVGADAHLAFYGPISNCSESTQGTVYVREGTFTADNRTSFRGNIANGPGSAIYVMGPDTDNADWAAEKDVQPLVALEGVAYENNVGTSEGSVVYVTGSALCELSQCTMTGNRGCASGSALTLREGAVARLENCSIAGITNAGPGACISVGEGTLLEMTGGTMKGSASIYGSCLDTAGTANLKNVGITGDSATQGGCIRQSGGTLDIDSCTISGGQAFTSLSMRGIGGCAYLQDGTMNVLGSTTVMYCAADTRGGAFYVAGGTLNVGSKVRITGCEAGAGSLGDGESGEGGGIALENGRVVLQGTIDDCTAVNGAGVFMTGGTLEIDGGCIEDNTADVHGGGLLMTPVPSTTVLILKGAAMFSENYVENDDEGESSNAFGWDDTQEDLYVDYSGTYAMADGSRPETVGNITINIEGMADQDVVVAADPESFEEAKLFARNGAPYEECFSTASDDYLIGALGKHLFIAKSFDDIETYAKATGMSDSDAQRGQASALTDTGDTSYGAVACMVLAAAAITAAMAYGARARLRSGERRRGR